MFSENLHKLITNNELTGKHEYKLNSITCRMTEEVKPTWPCSGKETSREGEVTSLQLRADRGYI